MRSCVFIAQKLFILGTTMIALGITSTHAHAAAKARPTHRSTPCPTFILEGELKPGLSETEKRLICGDPRSEAWRTIPSPQALFHLRNFLQARGYHHPEIEVAGEHQLVKVGERATLRTVTADGAPDGFRFEQKRDIYEQALTPELLTTIEQWTITRIQALGYPCPQVTAQANPDEGSVHLRIRTGPAQRLHSVIEEPIPGIRPGIFRRYDALRIGDPFNGDWLAVTADRINGQDLVQNIHLTPRCGPEGAIVTQEVSPGPPRLLRFGFGINTEGLLQGRASWRHTRLGDSASWFDVTGLFTAKEQRIESQLNWYHLPYPSRRSLRPSLRFHRQNETFFESLEGRLRVAQDTSWDGERLGFNLLVGPSYRLVRTFRGVGPRSAHFLFFEVEADLRSHEFEYYARDPRTGYRFTWIGNFGNRALLSSVTAQRIGLTSEILYNFKEYDPPLFVLGFRSSIDATFTEESATLSTGLPASFFHFLGGSSDLRGFGREELPEGGIGGLSAVYAGIEFRTGAFLPRAWQPFAFLDVGALGFRPFRIEKPIYYSPGIGLRWASPVGVFRTTLARGMPASLGHWQFYLSFGEEF